MTYFVEAKATHEKFRQAELHLSRGMYATARTSYEDLLEQSPRLDAEEAGALSWRLAYCLVMLGKLDEADRRIDEALRIPGISERIRARLHAVRSCASQARGDYLTAKTQAEDAARDLRTLGDSAGLTAALRWLAVTHLRLGNLEAAFENAYAALGEARHGELLADVAHARSLLSTAFIQRAMYQEAMEHAREAMEISERLGHQSAMVRNALHLSIAARLAGLLDDAARHATRALASAEESESPNLKVSARLALSRAFRELGRIDEAREILDGAAKLVEKSERDRDHVLVLEDQGDLDTFAGNHRSALAKYRKAWQKAEGIAANGDLVSELGWRIGTTLLELGEPEAAPTWIEKSLTIGERAGERKEVALALRARSLWHAKCGREDEARRDLQDTVSRLEALGTPYELARTHLTFDTVLEIVAENSPAIREERVRHLLCARVLFERCGAAAGVRAAETGVQRAIRTNSGIEGIRGVRGPGRAARVLDTSWKSSSFRETLDVCRKLGPSSLPLLLCGESGTGKTLVAAALHDLGRGREGDFFAVNCAALPEQLQESELFGHRKGAFTGADRDHAGIFREAGRGTVFLDEIDKTTLTFQAKLLQVLDTHEVRPVGASRLILVEARIIGATNRNLEELVAQGKFLEDLHHRLGAGMIHVPPLRRRREDLRALVPLLLDEVCSLERVPAPGLADDAWDVLAGHDWPGNVRELKSLLHRAIALNPATAVLDAAMVRASAPHGSRLRDQMTGNSQTSDLSDRMVHTEREEILRALVKADGVRKKAAELLGVSYRGLGKKMARLGILSDRAANH